MPPTPSPSVGRLRVPTLTHSHLVDLARSAAGWAAHRPWLAAIPVVLAMAGILAGARVRAVRHRRLVLHAQQVLITPPPEVDPAGAAAWWANLYELLAPSRWRRIVYGAPHIAVEYRWAGRELTIQVWLPGTAPAG